jgi:membrane fusion protein, multidrug efflux system
MKTISTIIVVIAAVFAVGCHENHEEHHEKSKFIVSTPQKVDTSITKDYVCQIHAINHIELRALDRGYLEEIFVDEGQMIKKGQLMFQIMPLKYKAEYQKALAEANYAEIEYENAKMLADSNVISSRQLALVKAKLEKAKAELAIAEVELSFTEIRAPFNGIMDRFHVRLGSLLEEGELLTTLSDNSKIWVYFNVPEAEYLDLVSQSKTQQKIPVKLLMANNKLFGYPGVVETIEADFNNETGNIAFRATFPNPDGLLRHGETGNILMKEPVNGALIIPQKATYEILDKKYVYVVNEEGVVTSRQIEVQAELPHLFVVSEGLSESDKILFEGLRKVKNIQVIDYEFIPSEKAIKSLNLYVE